MISRNFVKFTDQHSLTVPICKSFIIQCNWFEMNINGLKAEPICWDVRFVSRIGQISEPCAHF